MALLVHSVQHFHDAVQPLLISENPNRREQQRNGDISHISQIVLKLNKKSKIPMKNFEDNKEEAKL